MISIPTIIMDNQELSVMQIGLDSGNNIIGVRVFIYEIHICKCDHFIHFI
jgi:hypothetical protein